MQKVELAWCLIGVFFYAAGAEPLAVIIWLIVAANHWVLR